MPAVLLTTTFKARSGSPADNVVWTYAIAVPVGYNPATTVTALMADWQTAMSTNNGTGLSLAERLSPAYIHADGVGAVVGRLYDISDHLNGSPHGSPVGMAAVDIDLANGDAPLPAEVQVVLSLHAFDWQNQPVETPDGPDDGFAPDRPRSRYTGRQYVGPLGTGVMTLNANSQAVVKTDFRTDVCDYAERLHDLWVADDHYWSVWSRTDETLRALQQVSVDDAFDIIRKRGQRLSASNTRTLVP